MVTAHCNTNMSQNEAIKKEMIIVESVGPKINLSQPLELESSFEAIPIEPDDLQLKSSFEVLPVEPDNVTTPLPELVLNVPKPIEIGIEEAIPVRLHTAQLMTPLQEVGTPDTSLVDKIIMVDSQRGLPNLWTLSSQSSCFSSLFANQNQNLKDKRVVAIVMVPTQTTIDRLVGVCVRRVIVTRYAPFFRDCCPDVLLKHNITYDEAPRMFDCLIKRAVVYDLENIFCARCHNDSQFLDQWYASVTCAGSAGPLISTTHTKEDLYKKLVNRSSVALTTCESNVVKSLPAKTLDGTYNRLCNKVSPPLIDTCNASGKARFYDADIEQACALYESVFDGNYRNIFCYLCNQQYPYSMQYLINLVHVGYKANTARVSFAALLDLSGDEAWGEPLRLTIENDHCTATQVFDVATCECRKQQCSEGKYLDANGTCHSLIETDMLGYRACYRLDVVSDTPITEDSLRRLMTYTYSVLGDALREHFCSVIEHCPNSFNTSLYFEDLFATYGTLEYLEGLINSTRESYLLMVNTILQSVVSSNITTVYPCLAEVKSEGQCPSNLQYSIESIRGSAPIMIGTRTDIYYINYTQTSTCAFVSLAMENFVFEDDGEKMTFEPTGDQISSALVSFLDSSSNVTSIVRVCVSDYNKLAKPSPCYAKHDDFDTWTISGLVSIVSTSISLICLVLTFAVYAIVAPLRSGGGKNIMTLTALLFVAQALYEFGIEQFENRDFCCFMGLAVHFSWLAAVFSMNACTVERFLKLCFPLKTRSFFLSERRPFMLATGYSLICPFLIVTINIAASMASNGDLGYGSPRLCYINSRTSRIVAFATPMGAVVLANVFLLGITVWTLRTKSEVKGSENGHETIQSSIQSAKTNRVGLLGCIRLSVVTGITWLLVFLYEAIPSEALSYIITALVGLQGLIFFLSLVVNKRVMSMLKNTLKTPMTSRTSSTVSSSNKNRAHKKYKVKETVSEQISDSKTMERTT
ncbi:hypothetical protein RRG08_007315 [Elysia crispata]|uniref:G-protein coupled receptors family 2 profile 2 domain-containing protein n=1 Tax=Elysia crispata TaxID=231223 RepID=A0AAE0Y965_9GAST|nr:hypothetical protein RRG08_007315 [Elysia crispata]